MALLPAVLIALAVGWAFAPALPGGWLWDDALTILDNPLLRDGAGLRRIWLAPGTPDYFPLTASVQWLQWHLWGAQPFGYHVTNLALHLLSALLVWRILGKLGLRLAWLGGLIFAVHPLAVESVAWVSELKNTLSLSLLLLSISSYLDWEGRSAVVPPSRNYGATDPKVFPTGSPYLNRSYLLALLWFLAALLAKTSVVMLPPTLLLYAWWRRGRLGRADLLASAPFFGLSLALGLATLWFQRHHALQAGILPLGGAASRLAGAGLAAGFYLGKGLWPAALLPAYPRWSADPPALSQFLPGLALAALVLWLWAAGRRQAWARAGLFGLGCFLLPLVPILGFVAASFFHISWVADHFAYVSLPALAGLGAAAAGSGRANAGLRWACCGLIVLALAVTSHRHAAIFRSEESLWRYTLDREPASWIAANNLGKTVLKAGRAEEAAARLTEARERAPAFARAEIDLNLSVALATSGRLLEAIRRCEEAVHLSPADPQIRANLGNLYTQVGRAPEAIEAYQEALRIAPDTLGRPGMALTAAQRAEVGCNLGVALAKAGRNDEALEQFTVAVRLAPERADARNYLGIVLAGFGRLPEAKAQFEEALRLRPDFGAARENLARATRAAESAP